MENTLSRYMICFGLDLVEGHVFVCLSDCEFAFIVGG